MIEASDLTATDTTRPNTAAVAADQQRVRQALAVAIQRDQAPRKPRYGPSTVSCQPTPTPRTAPLGYRCAVVLHSETGPERFKHLVVCAAISAGRLTLQTGAGTRSLPSKPGIDPVSWTIFVEGFALGEES
jgi:hypothetical protein